tara:strand:+ start:1015 stop:1197 length:183 start_codon:yes stop_codon:yes gene_type:complete
VGDSNILAGWITLESFLTAFIFMGRLMQKTGAKCKKKRNSMNGWLRKALTTIRIGNVTKR